MIAFSLAVLFGLGWGFGLAASGTPSKDATFVFQLWPPFHINLCWLSGNTDIYSPWHSKHNMQTFSKLGTLKQTSKLVLMLKRGKVPQKPKMLNLLGRELLASKASSRLLLTVLSFHGNMGGMTMSCSMPVKPLPHKGR